MQSCPPLQCPTTTNTTEMSTAIDQQLPQLWLKHKKYDKVKESLTAISNGLKINS